MYKIIGGDQKEYGPVSFDQLAAWVRDNRANAQTLIQREGGPWVPLGSVPELAAILPSASAPGTGPTLSSASQPTFSSTPGIGGAGPTPPGGGTPWPGAPVSGGGGGDERARQLVQGPATGLLVVGILCALVSILSLVGNLLGAKFQPPPGDIPPELRQFFDAMKGMQGPVAIISSLFQLALSGVAIFAAQKMRNLENFTLVMTGTVLTMVPCISPCCCVGLPVGIWVLTALFKPEVKSAFR